MNVRDIGVGGSLLLCVVLLTGCAATPERALTVGSPTADVSAAAESTVGAPPASAPPTGAGHLSAVQAKAALLTVRELPSGWSAKANSSAKKAKSTVTPASCQTMFNSMKANGQGKPTTEAKATFTQGGMFGTELVMEISSYTDPVEVAKVQQIADALTTCSKITVTENGTTSAATFSPVSFPNLGERTLALRVDLKVQGISAVADLVLIAQGHNVVSFTTAGLSPLKGVELEKIARAGIAKVSAAERS